MTMNKDIFEENDRNIRVFGLETQKKLFESEVIIMNITPMMTELCKNLVLSGAGICLFDDNSKINENDSQNNFFFNVNDSGKKKAEILKSKIKTFKESCRINIIKEISEIDKLGMKYGVMDLSEGLMNNDIKKEIEKIMNESKNILYYVKIVKDKAIFLNNILEKKFLDENKNKNKDETRFVKDEKIIDHMDLSDDDEDGEGDTEKKVEEKKKNENIPEKNENKNDTKVIEISNNEDDDEKKIEILKENDYSYLDVEQKVKEIKELIPKNMKKNEEKVINDAFNVLNNNNSNNDDKKNPLNCLTNYVIGGVVCHEIINCISKKKNPRTNIYYYDSFIGTGKFLNELYDKVLDN
jgi:hypothetical protein